MWFDSEHYKNVSGSWATTGPDGGVGPVDFSVAIGAESGVRPSLLKIDKTLTRYFGVSLRLGTILDPAKGVGRCLAGIEEASKGNEKQGSLQPGSFEKLHLAHKLTVTFGPYLA